MKQILPVTLSNHHHARVPSERSHINGRGLDVKHQTGNEWSGTNPGYILVFHTEGSECDAGQSVN